MNSHFPRARDICTFLVVLLIVSITVSEIAVAQSQSSFKAGDDVQVYFLRKWHDAKVIETNKRGDVLAEFEFAAAPKRQAFKKNEVRFAFEADAILPGRTWADATGKFKVRAALIRIDDEKITLRKPDLQEISVAIDKLSDSDQAFLKRLQKEAGPAQSAGPELPPIENFDRNALSTSVGSANVGRQALTPDPAPGYLTIKEGGVSFPVGSVFDSVGAVLPLGGNDSWLLAAIENSQPSEPLPTRLLWASLAKQEIGGQQLLPPGEVVLDYHPSSHRLLTMTSIRTAGSTDEKEVLSVWEVLPADKQAKPIVRWDVTSDRVPNDPWARLVSADTVLHRFKNQEYVAWGIDTKAARYRVIQASFFAPTPTLSGGRKYFFLPEDKMTRAFDSTTGTLVSVFPAEDGTAGIAITDDGTRAAILGRTYLRIWDLTNASAPAEELQAEAIGTPFRADISWVDDQYLMADSPLGQVLFSLQHKLALWNYRFDRNAVRETRGRRLREISAGHLVYAASVGSASQRGLAVGAVKLPGPKVAETEASLDPDSLMIVKPSTPVKLDIRAGADSQRVQAAITSKVNANGWTISPSANVVIIAEMKQGQTQQVTYQSFGAGGGGGQSVSITPFISELRIEVDGKIAWQSMTSSGAPPVLSLEQGQSVQAEVNRWQRPSPEFFDNVQIPSRILDPAKRNGVGTTQVTNRGLVVGEGVGPRGR